MSTVVLTQKQADELLQLIRIVENETQISLREREASIVHYMISSGVDVAMLLARVEVVCPPYLDKEKIKENLLYVGAWVDYVRPHILTSIFKKAWGGAYIDSEKIVDEALERRSKSLL